MKSSVITLTEEDELAIAQAAAARYRINPANDAVAAAVAEAAVNRGCCALWWRNHTRVCPNYIAPAPKPARKPRRCEECGRMTQRDRARWVLSSDWRRIYYFCPTCCGRNGFARQSIGRSPRRVQMAKPTTEPTLETWVISERPKEYPTKIVARRHDVGRGGSHPTPFHFFADTIEELRKKLPQGLFRMDPMPEDDPHIVEIWF